jgi:transcription elongation factor GreA
MNSVIFLTEEGMRKLKAEIDFLTGIERPRITQLIAEARDKGDLSENAEYDAAKEAQGMLEAKIAQLQATMRNARIVDESKIDTTSVQLMNRVKIKNKQTEKIIDYYIVPEREADLKSGKISVTSPIAKGLLGKKVGAVAVIDVPAGKMTFEILEITL